MITGSSPRVWGTSSRTSSPGRAIAVHPHVCGEHPSAAQTDTTATRFIPTCVGNMPWPAPPSSARPVHPHVCGEHVPRIHDSQPLIGSSPRVWGTCDEEGRNLVRTRFIPTCVGNMYEICVSETEKTVHPHVCGEHGRILPHRLCGIAVHPHVCGEHVK